ncbi:CRISPR-associated endonuclease Cas2 [Azovibrio restrictus]|uniref:CRISPR-associated endonuclease Cas2 n=1 Tax=Azovibrio restrictus TaxID=146938 RepID=UPI0026EA52ED|nr:CRISPR-associated endonuclease Cas2 [Azovibrio restrictus]
MDEWVIGYDITCPRRLQRVHRAMVNVATPIEYSIFLFIGSERRLERCLDGIEALLDARTDDVRCYRLPARGLQERLGRATLPEGIQWTGLPAGLGFGTVSGEGEERLAGGG